MASTAVLASAEGSTLKQRVRLIHPNALAKNNNAKSAWITYQGKVYDVTSFAMDHPGGDDLILQYAGSSGDFIEKAMNDPAEHSHSESAFELLEELVIGKLATSEEQLKASADVGGNPAYFLPANDGVEIDEDYKPEETDIKEDFKKHQFLDFSKALVPQILFSDFKKDFFMQQVHSPRYVKGTPILLGGPLEYLTKTKWWIVPLFWLPISAALFIRSSWQFSQWNLPAVVQSTAEQAFNNSTFNEAIPQINVHASSASAISQAFFSNVSFDFSSISAAAFASTLSCFIAGVALWTILEYTLHRMLFHVDDRLPDKPVFLALHFLMHSYHHLVPMDQLRLVMPPALFFILSQPFVRLAYAILPTAIANGVISGSFASYVAYDVCHYALHFKSFPIRSLKKTHLKHHYSDPDRHFGVTSRFWDYVFGTE